MNSIVRRDTGEGYKEDVRKLAEKAGEDVDYDKPHLPCAGRRELCEFTLARFTSS
jgi:hypothetical protein